MATLYNPNLTAGATGKDFWRPWVVAVLDGLAYFANAYDVAFRFNPAVPGTFYNLGATAPTTFAVADAAGGTAFPLGTVVRYKLVFRNSSLAKETAPQRSTASDGSTVTWVQHTMVATRDVTITWTDPGGEFDKARIYRGLANADTFKFVADVAIGTATYTDSIADSTLRANVSITERYRDDLPPVPYFIGSALNRLWLCERGSTTVLFSQAADPLGELVQEDFPDANALQIGPEDGCGSNRLFIAHDDATYVFKDRACYEIIGDEVFTFVPRMKFNDRGALGPFCAAAVNSDLYILDYRGLYRWTPGASPQPVGRRPHGMQPIWDRMNLDPEVARSYRVLHYPAQRVIVAWIAIDGEPVANTPVPLDYEGDRLLGYDDLTWQSCAGPVFDSFGARHDLRIDDRAVLWEENYGASEGVYSGTTQATVTSGTGYVVNASAATFSAAVVDGVLGAPFERYSSAGAVLDRNRVEAATTTSLTPYYYSTSAVAANQTVNVGCIAHTWALPRLSWGSEKFKTLAKVVVDHALAATDGNLAVYNAKNDGSAASVGNVDLDADVRGIVPVNQSAWTHQLSFAKREAGLGVTVRGVHVYIRLGLDRST